MNDVFERYMERNKASKKLDINIRTTSSPLSKVKAVLPEGKKASDYRSRKALDRDLQMELPDGKRVLVSPRFWLSFSNVFSLSRSVFDYWTFNEVFERVSRQRREQNVRLAYELYEHRQGEGGVCGKLLSCTAPTRPVLGVDEVNGLIDRYNGAGITYKDGVANVTFNTPFPMKFNMGDSDYKSIFSIAMPLDGYGLPASYLGLLRMVCTNGMIAMTKAFKTNWQLAGDDTGVHAVLERALQTFNNEEGFHAMKDRIEMAQKSWASLHNLLTLQKALNAGATNERWSLDQRSKMLQKLDEATGYPIRVYGLMAANEPSPRVSRTLPVKATVHDLLNFASETATHQFKTSPARNRVHAWIGNILTAEYDLEGSCETYPDFSDIFIKD